jgi:hypothetical protein
MSSDIGIIIDNNNNLNTKVLSELYNSYIVKNNLDQFIIFASEPISLNVIPQLPLRDAVFFDGALVLFSNNALLIAKDFVNYSKLLYVIEEPAWTSISQNSSYNSIKELYTETRDLYFITSNQNIYSLYTTLWGNNIILGDINYEKAIL